MRSSRVIGGLGIVVASLGVALTASPAGALTTVCMARTPATAGKVPWTLRQASGLTSLPGADGILYTHNDRGLRDDPAPGEDTANAAVWAIKPDGTPLARYRLTAGLGGPPIPYFDTEAIGHDPAGHLVLADTGTNVDHRVVVAIYRFTPPRHRPEPGLRRAGRRPPRSSRSPTTTAPPRRPRCSSTSSRWRSTPPAARGSSPGSRASRTPTSRRPAPSTRPRGRAPRPGRCGRRSWPWPDR